MNSWSESYQVDIAATPEAIWALFADVSNWSSWNAGVGSIDIEGPFAGGTWFSMILPHAEVLRSQLVEVEAPRRFVDETRVEETVVRVEHRIDPLSTERCRVIFAVRAEGPQAAEIGPAASADFPKVLAGLARLLQS